MIINNNNLGNKQSEFLNSNFKKNNPVESSKINKEKKTQSFGFNEDLSMYKYTNPANKDAMYNKSLAMLQERYNNNLITLEEFKKQCNKIGKQRRNNTNNKK